jgi:hypothetical protein
MSAPFFKLPKLSLLASWLGRGVAQRNAPDGKAKSSLSNAESIEISATQPSPVGIREPLIYLHPDLPDWSECQKALSDDFNGLLVVFVELASPEEQDVLIDGFRQSGFQANYKNGDEEIERQIVGSLRDAKAVVGEFGRQIYFRRNGLWLLGNDGESAYAFAGQDITTFDAVLDLFEALKRISQALDRTVIITVGWGNYSLSHPILKVFSTGDLHLFPENYNEPVPAVQDTKH